MKKLFSMLGAFSIAFSVACFQKSSNNEEAATTPIKRTYATCYGNTPCKACTSCNYCKHCTAGGTCGICTDLKKSKPKSYKAPATTSGRCKATTKKGTQCSRSSRSGGYCWQHGGWGHLKFNHSRNYPWYHRHVHDRMCYKRFIAHSTSTLYIPFYQ